MTKKTILIIGAGGFIGQSLNRYYSENANYIVFPSTRSGSLGIGQNELALDITRKNETRNILHQVRPDIIINVSGMNGFSQCEENPGLAQKVNVDCIPNIISSIGKSEPLFVQFSTNAVFSGGDVPFLEHDSYSPITMYGRTKMMAEQWLLKEYPKHIIVRTCDVYGRYEYFHRNNRFLHFLEDKLNSQENVDVFSDVRSNPTYVKDLSRALELLVNREFKGIIHVAGPECMDRFQFASLFAQINNIPESLLTAQKAPTTYSRNSCLNTSLLNSHGFEATKPRKGLDKYSQSRIGNNL